MKLLTGTDQTTAGRALRIALVIPLLFAFVMFGYLFLVCIHVVSPFDAGALTGFMGGVYVGAAMDMILAMSVLKRSDAVARQKDRELADARVLLAEAGVDVEGLLLDAERRS